MLLFKNLLLFLFFFLKKNGLVSDDSECRTTTVDERSAYKLTAEGGVSVWSIIWSPFGGALRSMGHEYLTDSIDLGVFNTPGESPASFVWTKLY